MPAPPHDGGAAPLPTPGDVDRISALPLVFLVAMARSGSMLVQAFLDGHEEILQWPHTLKLFDFLAANPDFAVRDGGDLGRAFADFPAHGALFDSSQSVLHRGRLGEDMRAELVIDRVRFVEAMATALPHAGGDARHVAAAIHASLAACLGWSTAKSRVLLIHLHHGDWLWPATLVETCNAEPPPPWRGIDLLRPDKVVVCARHPVESIESIEVFCQKSCSSPAEAAMWFERYLRLLVQDWLRIALFRSAELDLRVVHLEALRRDSAAELAAICRWLGVSADSAALREPSAYRLPWWGDSYSAPMRRPKPPRPGRSPSWKDRDHVFFDLGAGRAAAESGYPRLGGARSRWAERWPALALWVAERLDRREGRPAAPGSVWRERSAFLRGLQERVRHGDR